MKTLSNTSRKIKRYCATLTAVGLSAAAATGAQADRPVPHGAFLLTRVHSVRELVNEVRSHPLVLHRYEMVFSMTRAQLFNMFEHLTLSRLPADETLEVWFIHQSSRGEYSGYHLVRLKKGDLVFMKPGRRPMLLQICGNMLTMVPRSATVSLAPTGLPGNVDVNATSAFGTQLAMVTPGTTPADVVNAAMMGAPGVTDTIPGLLSSANHWVAGLLWLLPPAAGATAMASGGGSRTTTTLQLPSVPLGSSSSAGQPPLFPPSVPEASTALGLLSTILTGAALRTRSSRRKR